MLLGHLYVFLGKISIQIVSMLLIGLFVADWKRSVFILTPKKGDAKEYSNYHTIAFISHASKVMLKILQASLSQYVNHELPDVQAGFRKGRGTAIKLPTSIGSSKK